jgi:hypothetical protein
MAEAVSTSQVALGWNASVFGLMRKMRPLRQVEVAEHMITNGTFSFSFVKALLYATKPDALIERAKGRPTQSAPDITASRLSHESDSLLKDLKNLEDSFGKDALVLTVARGYLERLLSNPQILRYLEKKHNDSLSALKLWMENKQLSG